MVRLSQMPLERSGAHIVEYVHQATRRAGNGYSHRVLVGDSYAPLSQAFVFLDGRDFARPSFLWLVRSCHLRTHIIFDVRHVIDQ